ncbi:hypothetical protein LEP1GSC168_0243 [Leptospira santarosai str. HAI134]|nr:hypothetical protein LEP1GSC168_0243 [Leptospira santarosai str. HAI134]
MGREIVELPYISSGPLDEVLVYSFQNIRFSNPVNKKL